jgi:glycerophosphoryl diester phosphodiesterase
MRHPFFAASRPLVFAHRGGSALAPENTIAAFDNGLALGADGLELEVLDRYRDARIIVEMKVNHAELAASTVEVIRRAGAVDRVCLGSFGWRVLRAARALEPRLATSAAREEVRWWLYRSWCRWPVARVGYSGFQVPEVSGQTRVISPRFIDYAHRAGLGVQVWTVDEEEDARRLLGWGVDALITDRPDVIVPLVRGTSSI